MKNEIIQTGRRLYERGMVAGTDGNISVRLDDDRIMVTPSGFPLGRLAPEDLVTVDINGKPLQGKHPATSELKLHLFVYQNRPDVRACVHSHALYATAFSVAGMTLAEDILPEIVLFVGNIPITEYAQPGTDAVARAIEPYLEKHHAFLLRNHGLVTLGRSLDEAYHRHETVEHFAHVVFVARQLGRLDTIPSEDFERLKNIRDKLDEVWGNKA